MSVPQQFASLATDAGSTAPVARTPVGWFHDLPARGTWNMALDEALLHHAANGGSATLRFYEWIEPTLSLGYFQRYADRAKHAASRDCAVVRRTTGGGAILHDCELTYSCALPAGHPLGRRANDLYQAIHESIAVALGEYGLNATLLAGGGETIAAKPQGRESSKCGNPQEGSIANDEQRTPFRTMEPFLCFERRTSGDVLLDGWKVVGSAQRRHQGAVLQHGSILLRRSAYASHLPGIDDLSHQSWDSTEFVSRVRNALSARAGFDLVFARPPAEVNDRATAIEDSKFAGDHWLRLR